MDGGGWSDEGAFGGDGDERASTSACRKAASASRRSLRPSGWRVSGQVWCSVIQASMAMRSKVCPYLVMTGSLSSTNVIGQTVQSPSCRILKARSIAHCIMNAESIAAVDGTDIMELETEDILPTELVEAAIAPAITGGFCLD
mmetsp:Transcript_64672/g.173297  ORF Transcript_64672/g.173297 Transcript_64672/m.173297 type:complete len:143 (+) Transcript_64672:453-881(+)